MADLKVTNHGSLFTIVGESDAGTEWLNTNVIEPNNSDGEPVLMWGNGVVVEPRYLEQIVLGARDDGLEVA